MLDFLQYAANSFILPVWYYQFLQLCLRYISWRLDSKQDILSTGTSEDESLFFITLCKFFVRHTTYEESALTVKKNYRLFAMLFAEINDWN